MSGTAQQTSATLPESNVAPDIVESIQELTERNLVVVNEDNRTWEVTEIVDKEYGGDDERTSKRVARLESGPETTFALVLEAYPNQNYRAELHVLETEHWYEEGKVHDVESVEILDTDISWTVVRRHGGSPVFHRPDPFAAAHGDAQPACDGAHVVDADGYRVVGYTEIYPAKRACMDCFRRRLPREVERVNCPECGCRIGRGFLHGPGVEAVDSVYIDCPADRCSFTGRVSLDGGAS